MRRSAVAILLMTLAIVLALPPAHAFNNDNATSRLVGEVFANGQQMRYLTMLSDEIGSRLTGSTGGAAR
jgi:hypothetical protein